MLPSAEVGRTLGLSQDPLLWAAGTLCCKAQKVVLRKDGEQWGFGHIYGCPRNGLPQLGELEHIMK